MHYIIYKLKNHSKNPNQPFQHPKNTNFSSSDSFLTRKLWFFRSANAREEKNDKQRLPRELLEQKTTVFDLVINGFK